MSKEGMTLADQLKAEAAQREKQCGEHPSLETLTDYALGELDEQVAEGLRDHLAFCQRCADQYLTIDGPLDFEIDMSLTQKPDFLKPIPTPEQPAEPPPAPAALPDGTNTARGGRLRMWMGLTAAACLVIGFQLGRRQPQVDPPQFALRAEGTQRNTGTTAFAGDARDMVVYYRNFDWKNATRCNIEVVTPDGRRVSVESEHPRTPGVLILTVPTALFRKAGEYRFDVWDSDRENTPLGSLYLSIEDSHSASVNEP